MKRGTSQIAGLTDDMRYRLLVEAVTDYAIYMLDPDGIVTSWNPGAQRFKGYLAHEIIGKHFSNFYTEDDRAAGAPQRALSIAATEGRFETEGWRVRKDGTRFWANVVIDPIREPGGNLLGFAKVTRDLTSRRAAEEELRRSEERFRLLVGAVTDYAIYMLDPDGLVTNWNAGAERIKGYRPDEIVGRHFSTFYTEEDRASGEPARALATARNEGRFEKEGWRLRKDGTRFWASVVIDPIRADDGSLVGFAKVTRDITERMESQRALEAAREQLFQSQKMESLGQLSGGIAHDFNNLLMAVLGSLELMRKRLPDDPRMVRLLDNAVQGAKRGATLTQRMLGFARRQELAVEPIDLERLIEGMSELLRSSLGPRMSIRADFPDGLRPALADANQLELAVMNIAINARDAMPEGGVIEIGARAAMLAAGNAKGLDPGDYVGLFIVDSGEGMDAATLARSREPFFTTKGPGKGTGLGLSLVHGVMEQLGGRLVIDSAPGIGTTVELWLRAAEQAVAGLRPQREEATSAERSLRVLVVDDDALVLFNTTEMLDDLGHEALSAGSARTALDILARSEPFDVVVTDQVMPHMTGIELVAAVRRDHPGLPFVLATGYAELPPGSPARLTRLAKPFRQEDLARAITEAVAAQRG